MAMASRWHMLGRCVPSESREINRLGCRGDIQELTAARLPGKRQHYVRHFTHNVCWIYSPPASAKTWVNSYQVNLIHIFMSYPGRHLHGCVCLCDAARFWDVQDGGVEERKRRAPDGLIRSSAPCSDWSMLPEVSRLNSRAAQGGLESTRGLIWRLRF